MSDAAEGFAPVSRHDAKVLILGSMPGQKSLQEARYYAHPRNAFWKIMGELLGIDFESGYDERLLALQEHRVALWDVLKFCERPGSLDSAIKNDSLIVNNFEDFFASHTHIHTVFFNGNKAAELYRKHASATQHQLIGLPSTSPANAGMNFAQKLDSWAKVGSALE
jgi:TDG/mug DNA glycosylase family protein